MDASGRENSPLWSRKVQRFFQCVVGRYIVIRLILLVFSCWCMVVDLVAYSTEPVGFLWAFPTASFLFSAVFAWRLRDDIEQFLYTGGPGSFSEWLGHSFWQWLFVSFCLATDLAAIGVYSWRIYIWRGCYRANAYKVQSIIGGPSTSPLPSLCQMLQVILPVSLALTVIFTAADIWMLIRARHSRNDFITRLNMIKPATPANPMNRIHRAWPPTEIRQDDGWRHSCVPFPSRSITGLYVALQRLALVPCILILSAGIWLIDENGSFEFRDTKGSQSPKHQRDGRSAGYATVIIVLSVISLMWSFAWHSFVSLCGSLGKLEDTQHYWSRKRRTCSLLSFASTPFLSTVQLFTATYGLWRLENQRSVYTDVSPGFYIMPGMVRTQGIILEVALPLLGILALASIVTEIIITQRLLSARRRSLELEDEILIIHPVGSTQLALH